MKLAILSDSHDNLTNLQKACHWLNEQGIKIMIHCGDLASRETIIELSRIYQGQVYLVFGNMDRDYVTREEIKKLGLKNIHVFNAFGEVQFNGYQIAFSHHPGPAKKLVESGKYNFVFYGHTHKPWLEKIGQCQLVNPGNLAGQIYQATFAVYDLDSGKLELKILEKM